jgi:preprotein translocase subunit SecA
MCSRRSKPAIFKRDIDYVIETAVIIVDEFTKRCQGSICPADCTRR